VVFYLVTNGRAEPLTPKQEQQVGMLVYSESDKYAAKVKGLVKAGLGEFDQSQTLAGGSPGCNRSPTKPLSRA
jgi:hypothetical protein